MNAPLGSRRWWDAAQEAFRRLGAWNGALYLVSRALDRVSAGRCRLLRYRLVAQPVPEAPLVPPHAPGSMEFYEATEADPLVWTLPRPHHILRQRYARGARCFLARRAEQLVGCIWIQEGPYEEDEVRCLFVPERTGETAWDFDVYVVPEFRLGRAFARLWDYVNADLRGKGYRWSASRISAFNAASIAAHERLGIVLCGTATFLSCGRLQLSFLTQAPFLHVSVSAGTRPVVRVCAPRRLAGEREQM